jgi:hypothetical protein
MGDIADRANAASRLLQQALALRAELDHFIDTLSLETSERRWFRFLRPFLEHPLTLDERVALAHRLRYKSVGGFYGRDAKANQCLWLGEDFLARLTRNGEDFLRRMIAAHPDWEEEFSVA